MINYSIPHIYFKDFFLIPFCFNYEKKLVNHFQEYTGKKYVLLTSSCRSALYLAYRSISNNNGEVITSPLTCTSAVSPMVEAGITPKFIDVNLDTFLMDENKIESAVSEKTIAIQAIHLGGRICEMVKIMDIAREKKLLVIEDCAQGYGAKYNNRNCGSFGDIACFSLAKNIFGLGGGVLATNDISIYEKALLIQSEFETNSRILTYYRLFRGLIDTYPKNIFFNLFRRFIFIYRNSSNKVNQRDERDDLRRMLRSPNKLEIKVAAYQLYNKSERLLNRSIKIADALQRSLEEFLKEHEYSFHKHCKVHKVSFVKFYLYRKGLDSKKNIEKLNNINRIEVKHLENKSNSFFQDDFTKILMFQDYVQKDQLKNYFNLHKDIVTLPFNVNLTENNLIKIGQCLNEY